MPTPSVHTRPEAKPLFEPVPAGQRRASIDLLKITDRARAVGAEEPLPYTSTRSRAMAFGSVVVNYESSADWVTLATESAKEQRSASQALCLGPTKELGHFPDLPYRVRMHGGWATRHPESVGAHVRAADALRAEIGRRVAASASKEIVLYIHGFNNKFDEAGFTMAALFHFLGREQVCAIFTWPAGRSGGLHGMFGYAYDRESGVPASLPPIRVAK